MNVEQEIIDKAAKNLADEIDWGILADIYLSSGWTEVVVSNYTQKYRQGMADWIYENIKGHKTGYRERWLFKDAKDATFFSLRWA